MAGGYTVGIASETKAFKQGIESGVIDPLEDAVQALDDLGKSRGPDKLEDGFRDAQTASKKLEREVKETADTIERDFRQSYGEMKRASSSSTASAQEDLRELANEARTNVSETLSSFDGSIESLGDVVQGTLGGVVGGLTGPAGLFAAAAGAAGVGLVIKAINDGAEDSEAFREQVAELSAELIETGGKGAEALDGVVERLKTMATEVEEGAGLPKLVDLYEKVGKTGGRNFEDIAAAYAGSADKLDELIEKEKEYLDELDLENRTITQNAEESDEAYNRRQQHASDQVIAQKAIVDELEKAADAADLAADSEAAYLASGAEEMANKAQAIGTIDAAYDGAAGAAADFINKETGVLDTGAYIASMQEREQALANYQSALATVDLSPEAKAFIDSQGFEAASAFLSGYESASDTQKAELNRIWSEAAKTNSGTYMSDLDKAFAEPVDGPTIKAPVVPAPDMSALERALATPYSMRINVKPYDARSGKPIP